MTHVFSIRVPADWQGRATGEQVRSWVIGWLHHPTPIPQDPGPGTYKLSVRLTGRELAALRGAQHRAVSSTVRQIAAVHISTPKERGPNWLRVAFHIILVLLAILARTTGDVANKRGQDT